MLVRGPTHGSRRASLQAQLRGTIRSVGNAAPRTRGQPPQTSDDGGPSPFGKSKPLSPLAQRRSTLQKGAPGASQDAASEREDMEWRCRQIRTGVHDPVTEREVAATKDKEHKTAISAIEETHKLNMAAAARDRRDLVSKVTKLSAEIDKLKEEATENARDKRRQVLEATQQERLDLGTKEREGELRLKNADRTIEKLEEDLEAEQECSRGFEKRAERAESQYVDEKALLCAEKAKSEELLHVQGDLEASNRKNLRSLNSKLDAADHDLDASRQSLTSLERKIQDDSADTIIGRQVAEQRWERDQRLFRYRTYEAVRALSTPIRNALYHTLDAYRAATHYDNTISNSIGVATLDDSMAEDRALLLAQRNILIRRAKDLKLDHQTSVHDSCSSFRAYRSFVTTDGGVPPTYMKIFDALDARYRAARRQLRVEHNISAQEDREDDQKQEKEIAARLLKGPCVDGQEPAEEDMEPDVLIFRRKKEELRTTRQQTFFKWLLVAPPAEQTSWYHTKSLGAAKYVGRILKQGDTLTEQDIKQRDLAARSNSLRRDLGAIYVQIRIAQEKEGSTKEGEWHRAYAAIMRGLQGEGPPRRGRRVSKKLGRRVVMRNSVFNPKPQAISRKSSLVFDPCSPHGARQSSVAEADENGSSSNADETQDKMNVYADVSTSAPGIIGMGKGINAMFNLTPPLQSSHTPDLQRSCHSINAIEGDAAFSPPWTASDRARSLGTTNDGGIGDQTHHVVPEEFWTHQSYSPGGHPVEVLYCRDLAESEQIAKLFLGQPVLGLDLEWEPRAPSWSGIKNNVSVIQLAAEDRVAIFQIAAFKGNAPNDLLAPTLKAILEDDRVVKAGVNIGNDFSRLGKFLDVKGQGIFELSHLYKLVYYAASAPEMINKKPVKLTDQVERVFGLPLRKDDVRCSAWSLPLSTEQVDYAATDAYAGFQLYTALERMRLAMEPVPPRPSYQERKEPIFLANGQQPPKSVRSLRAVPRSQTSGLKVDGQGPGDAGDLIEATAGLSLDETSYKGQSEAADVEDDRASDLQQPTNGDARIAAADAWAQEYRARRLETHRSVAGYASVRAYALWHNHGLTVEEVAVLRRERPIQPSTVRSYVVQTIACDLSLPYDRTALREFIRGLPWHAAERYKWLAKRLDDVANQQ